MLRKLVTLVNTPIIRTYTQNYQTLSGKLAVVVGASKGIGKAVASTLANKGASVALVSRTVTAESSAQLPTVGVQKHQHYVCDVCNEDDVTKVFHDIEKQHFTEGARGIDILINCAGINKDGLLAQYPVDAIHQLIRTNVVGTMITCKTAVKSMLRHKIAGGCIVNVSSIVGHTRHAAGQSVYAATKSAVVGFSKSLAKEVISRKIRVNAVAPGFVNTEMTRYVAEKDLEGTVTGDMATVDDIAQSILFLVESRYITGQVLVVDGGLSL
jgi:carbonyl reductase 4